MQACIVSWQLLVRETGEARYSAVLGIAVSNGMVNGYVCFFQNCHLWYMACMLDGP